MKGRPLRVGVIGAGRWARAIIATLNRLPEWRLVRIARSRLLPVEGAPPDIEVCTDWRAVAESNDLDAVILAVHPGLQPHLLSACIRRRLPVFAEKPLALTSAESRQLLELAEHFQPIVFVDHIHLFSPAFRALVQEATDRGPFEIESAAGNPPDRPVHDFGVLWDWGPHDVAMDLALLGEIPLERADSRSLGRLSSLQEMIELRLAFADGTVACHRFGNLWPAKRREYVARAGGTIWRYDDVANQKFAIRRRGEEIYPPVPTEPPLTVALREFAAAVTQRLPNYGQLRLGARVVEILERCISATSSERAHM